MTAAESSGESPDSRATTDDSLARFDDDGGPVPRATKAADVSRGAASNMTARPTVRSGELTVRDHARLAEGLADHIGRLRQARLTHRHDIDQIQDQLQAFATEKLVPYLHAEEVALRQEIGAPRRSAWLRGKKRINRRLQEHRRMIEVAHALRLADTDVLALARAEDLKALLFSHLAREDRELLANPRPATDDDTRPSSGTVALTAELGELLVHDHTRITAAVATAHAAAAHQSDDEIPACDRAVAALSQHAAVMSTRAYPMVRRVLPRSERAATRPLSEDLRCAERAMRHLNRLLRGASAEDMSYQNRDRLWDEVEQAWQRHVAAEEPLLRRVAPLLRTKRVLRLITSLRRPAGHSLTRPHPSLLYGGWPTKLAIRAQYRIDHWRDLFDNRDSWRTGD